MKIERISYSNLSTFQNCPRMWWARYVEKIKQPSTNAAAIGSTFGDLVAERSGAILDPKSPRAQEIGKKAELEEADKALMDKMLDTYESKPWAWKVAERAEEEVWIEGKELIRYSKHYGIDPGLRSMPAFVGYVDLSRHNDTIPQVLDLKTSARAGFQPGWMLQVPLYALKKRAGVAEIHLVTRAKTPRAIRYQLPMEREVFVNALQWVTSTWRNIHATLKAGKPPVCNPGYWCTWCPIGLECRVRFMHDKAGVEEE